MATFSQIEYKSLTNHCNEVPVPEEYQEKIIIEYSKHGRRRNWAFNSIKKQQAVIRDVLLGCDKLLWKLTETDLDNYVDALIEESLSASYRRTRLSTFRAFYQWLIDNYKTEIWILFKHHLIQPVTSSNQIIHVSELEHDARSIPHLMRL